MATDTEIARGQFFIGAAHSLIFDITNAAGTPQTMTGWDLEFIIRVQSADGTGTMIVTKTTATGSITIGNGSGTNDRATVSILSADTAGVFPDTFSYSLWRTDDPSDQPLAYGSIVLTAVARE